MGEQLALLEGMLAQAEACVKELAPRLEVMLGEKETGIGAVEGAVFEAVVRLGSVWLGLVLSLAAGRLAATVGTRRPCPCGGIRRWVAERSKTVLSIVGRVTYWRVYYHCAECKTGEGLGDARWGLAHSRTTAGVKQLAAYVSASLGFVETARQVCRSLHWPEGWLSGKQVQRLAQAVGQRLGEAETRQVTTWWELATAARTSEGRGEPVGPVQRAVTAAVGVVRRLYIEMDGVLVRFRGEAGPGRDEWHEVKVGAVFVAEPGPHASGLLAAVAKVRGLMAPAVRTWVDRPAGAISYVAGRLPAAVFGIRLYAEAVRRGLDRAQEVVVLGDGAHWIWELAATHFPGAIQILDYFHASEWVWDVAKAVWGSGSAKAAAWATEQIAQHLMVGDAAGLIAAIAALPPVAPPPGETRSLPEQAVTYFRNNAERMHYPEYRARGLVIGSGAVESAAKRVVGQRCKGPGMRWSDAGLAAVLHLRTHVLNGRYDQALAALPKAA